MSEPLVFIHLSDIHFNKKWHDHYELDRDLRDQIELDVELMKTKFPLVTGVLVSGDIAFGGKKAEYEIALEWLKTLCGVAGCREQAVWCIPGNHDVDRAIYDNSRTLRDYHNILRPADPTEVDDLIADYLREDMAAQLLFKPIEEYNESFAAKFSCRSLKDPLAWQHDLKLNDGSTLRIHGINSVLASDRTDKDTDRKLVVGTVQAGPKEASGVTYLTMCHHPPDWLLDGGTVKQRLNTRAQVQLFGHKHFQVIDVVNNCLHIGAGAVHPSRKEKDWVPRYNWLSLSVRATKHDRFLDVDVHPRIWHDLQAKFLPDYHACGGAEHKAYPLNLKPWTPPATTTAAPVATAGGVSPGGTAMVTIDSADAARTLTYRFLDLSHITRIEIVQELDLYKNEDEGVRDPELLERIFRRAKDGKLLAQLWDLVEKQHDDGLYVTNPYEGR